LLDCIASHSHIVSTEQESQDVIHWIQTVEVYTFHAVAASRVSYRFSKTSSSRYCLSICIKHASMRRWLDPGEFRRFTESNFHGVEVIIWPVTPPSDLTSIFSTQSLNFSVRLLVHSISIKKSKHGIWPMLWRNSPVYMSQWCYTVRLIILWLQCYD